VRDWGVASVLYMWTSIFSEMFVEEAEMKMVYYQNKS
jgi:hypothetical protein